MKSKKQIIAQRDELLEELRTAGFVKKPALNLSITILEWVLSDEDDTTFLGSVEGRRKAMLGKK